MSTFDPTTAARLIAEAQNAKRLLKEIPELQRPKSLDEGYAVQDRIAADTGRAGGVADQLSGWKLGLGSANAMKGANLKRPVIGRMWKSRFLKPDAPIAVPATMPALIEIEIAFTLARDVTPNDRIANPLDAVAQSNIVSEIVFSRFEDRKTVGLPSFAADSVGFHALVIGHTIDIKTLPAIVTTLSVTADGKEVQRAATGDDAIDPVAMLAHLMDHARERGLTLKKGDVVTTGTLSRPFEQTSPAMIAATADGVKLSYTMKP